MPIQFNCIQCNKTIETPDNTAGKKCRCPDCGQVMPIPDPEIPIGQSYVDSAGFSSKPSDHAPNPFAAASSRPSPVYGSGSQHFEPADRSPIILMMGIASIAISFLSCACCFLFFPFGLALGVPAWIMGNNDLKEIQRGRRNANQRGVLQAGMICGIVGVCLAAVFMILRLALFFLQIGVVGLQGFAP